mmetsp:Transcript_126629/g.270135  ORF Transcript_126629/g.270135 Transcript_126629/m.270135 type:complete len:453 (+) Transcript_126629:90-1448(+)
MTGDGSVCDDLENFVGSGSGGSSSGGAAATASAAAIAARVAATALEQAASQQAVLSACAFICTLICITFVLLKLSGVLVPLTFAVFLAFLMEPVLAFLVRAPEGVARLWRRWFGLLRRHRAAHSGPLSTAPVAGTAGVEGAALATTKDAEGTACHPIFAWLQGFWDVVSIILCLALLVGLLGGLVAGCAHALTTFDWDEYLKSPKLKEVQHYLEALGITAKELWSGSLLKRYRDQVVDAALEIINVVGSVALTLLLFFFSLVAILPGIHRRDHRPRVRTMMQRYLLCKTMSSLFVAGACALALWFMGVDLVLLFALITFAFNFIPNVGSFFAVLAPLPLVALDPHTNIMDVILVALVPFLIHNTLGNVIEPKLMASGLDLHPLTVVVALTFWGTLWGIAGAVLSVPITCAIRLWLAEVDHPYARLLHGRFDAPFCTSTAYSDQLTKNSLQEP